MELVGEAKYVGELLVMGFVPCANGMSPSPSPPPSPPPNRRPGNIYFSPTSNKVEVTPDVAPAIGPTAAIEPAAPAGNLSASAAHSSSTTSAATAHATLDSVAAPEPEPEAPAAHPPAPPATHSGGDGVSSLSPLPALAPPLSAVEVDAQAGAAKRVLAPMVTSGGGTRGVKRRGTRAAPQARHDATASASASASGGSGGGGGRVARTEGSTAAAARSTRTQRRRQRPKPGAGSGGSSEPAVEPPSTPPAMTGGVTEDDLRAKLRPVFDKVCDRTRRLPIRSYPDPK